MNDIQAKIDSATTETAIEYSQADEKYLFCIDYLEISAHDYDANDQVDALEDKFDDLLLAFVADIAKN